MTAVQSHVISHAPTEDCRAAINTAPKAMIPTATCAQPETAVKDEARSIVSRMKRRLSIARSCSAGGSAWDELNGLIEDIAASYSAFDYCQALFAVKCRTGQLDCSRC